MKTKIKLSKERMILLGIPALGLFVGLLGNMALVSPLKGKASKADADIASAQTALIAAHAKPPAPVDVHAADIFRLTKAMPDTDDMAGILLQLSRLAKQSGVALQSITPAARLTMPTGYGAVPVVVTMTGRYAGVTKFVQLVRQQVSVNSKGTLRVGGRLMLANQVSLTSSDGKTVSATINLDAFVYGTPPPPPAPVGPTGAAGATPAAGASR